MKISNLHRTRSWMIVLFSIIIFSIISLLFLVLIPISSNLRIPIFIPSIIILLFSSIQLVRLKYFQFENAGEFITIKYRHPIFHKRKFSELEFPTEKIFSIEMTPRYTDIILKFYLKRDNKEGNTKRYFRVAGMNREQVIKIQNSIK